jgi:putative phosphoesterase
MMKLGLLADIHGNLFALDAVLADLAADRVDRLVCLGDSAALGPHPSEVIARLRSLACPSVLGNVDAWFLGAGSPDQSDSTHIAWAEAQLTDADRAYLRACPMTLDLPLAAGLTLRACHASPRSYHDVIAAGTPPGDLLALVNEPRPAILAGGHTHRQLLRRDGDLLFLNPGSVGLPGVGPTHPLIERNRQVAWAEYAVIDARNGRLSIDLRRIPLDLPRMFAAARATTMPDLDWWLGLWTPA